MKILKCIVGLSDGMIVTCDGVAHQGRLYIVTAWLAHPTEPFAIPERIIRFDCFPHQADPESDLIYQNILLPISESDLLGQLPPGIEYEDHPQSLRVDIFLVRPH